MDIRAFVVDGRIVGAMRRTGKEGSSAATCTAAAPPSWWT